MCPMPTLGQDFKNRQSTSCPICVPGHKPTTFENSAKSCPICVPGHKPTTFGNSTKSCPICVPGQHWDTFYFLSWNDSEDDYSQLIHYLHKVKVVRYVS